MAACCILTLTLLDANYREVIKSGLSYAFASPQFRLSMASPSAEHRRAEEAERRHVARRAKTLRRKGTKGILKGNKRTTPSKPARKTRPAPLGHGLESDRRMSNFVDSVVHNRVTEDDSPPPYDSTPFEEERKVMQSLVAPDDPLTTMHRQMERCNTILQANMEKVQRLSAVQHRGVLPGPVASPRPDGLASVPPSPSNEDSQMEGQREQEGVRQPSTDHIEIPELPLDEVYDTDGLVRNYSADAERSHVSVRAEHAVQPRTPRRVMFSRPNSARDEDDDEDFTVSAGGLPSLRAVTPRQGRPQLHSRVLCFMGDLNWSLVHHLGVLVYYVESGLLHSVTHICAEHFAIPLALLVRVHWEKLCAHRGDAQSMVNELFWPVTMFMYNNPREWGEVWRHYCRRQLRSENQAWMSTEECELKGLPRMHCFVHRDPDKGNHHGGSVAYFSDDRLHNLALPSMLPHMWRFWYSRGRRSLPPARQPPVKRTAYTWVADLLPVFAQDADLEYFDDQDRQFQVWMSYAGRSTPIPMNPKNFGPNDPGALLNVYEFASTFWSVATSPKALSRVSELTVYNVHHGASYHSIHLNDLRDRGIQVANASDQSRVKAMVITEFRRSRSLPVWQLERLDPGLNWGYLVCRLTEAGVGRYEDYLRYYSVDRETGLTMRPPHSPAPFPVNPSSTNRAESSEFNIDKLGKGSLSSQLTRKGVHNPYRNKVRCGLCKWFSKKK